MILFRLFRRSAFLCGLPFCFCLFSCFPLPLFASIHLLFAIFGPIEIIQRPWQQPQVPPPPPIPFGAAGAMSVTVRGNIAAVSAVCDLIYKPQGAGSGRLAGCYGLHTCWRAPSRFSCKGGESNCAFSLAVVPPLTTWGCQRKTAAMIRGDDGSTLCCCTISKKTVHGHKTNNKTQGN